MYSKENLTKVDTGDLISRMGRLDHFKNLSAEELGGILAAGEIRPYAVDVTLFREEEPCAGVFVLVKGEVHLFKTGPDGREHIMASLEPIAMFNEVPVLDGGPNPATAVTAAECLIWSASSPHFNELLRRYPQVAVGLLPILASRNRWLVSQYEDLSFRSVRARMAKLLLDLSDNGQLDIDRRQHPVHELAARIATVPEAVSRSLGDLRRYGCISCTRTTIAVRDGEELVRLAQLNPDLSL